MILALVPGKSSPDIIEILGRFHLYGNCFYLPKTLQQPANILDTWSEVMMTQIAPMLAVSHGNAAIDFYEPAFDTQLLWPLGGGGDVVAPGQL